MLNSNRLPNWNFCSDAEMAWCYPVLQESETSDYERVALVAGVADRAAGRDGDRRQARYEGPGPRGGGGFTQLTLIAIHCFSGV